MGRKTRSAKASPGAVLLVMCQTRVPAIFDVVFEPCLSTCLGHRYLSTFVALVDLSTFVDLSTCRPDLLVSTCIMTCILLRFDSRWRSVERRIACSC